MVEPLNLEARPVGQPPCTAAQAAQPPMLDAVLAQSTPQPGQIVLGQLTALPAAGQAGTAEVRLLGAVRVSASLVALTEADLGQSVALSLLPDGQALLLGKLWDGRTPSLEVQMNVQVDDEAPEHRVIEAEQRLELRCGEASLVLHADGRIQLRGHYITSHAQATQRIHGGAVHVN